MTFREGLIKEMNEKNLKNISLKKIKFQMKTFC